MNHISYFHYIINLIIILIIIKDINSISKDLLKTIDGKINENTIEDEISKIIKEYDKFNEGYNKLSEQQNQNKDKEDYDRFKYKGEFKKLFNECELFYEYFFKQRKRLSDFINKPTGKIPDKLINLYNIVVEYVLESKNLLEDLGVKAFIDNTDL